MSPSAGNGNSDFLSNIDDEVARQRYQDLIKTVNDGIYQLSADSHFTAVNEVLTEITGYSRNELIGEHASVLFTDDGIERLESEIERQRDSLDPSPVELSVQTAHGEPLECTVRVSVMTTDSEFRGSLGVVQPTDATQPSSHEPLPASKNVLRSLVEESEVPAFLLDAEYNVVWADEALGRYFGVDPSELVGRNKRRAIEDDLKHVVEHPDQFENRLLATYNDNSFIEEFPVHVTAAEDREEHWLVHRSKPVRSGQFAGGRIEWYTDVSERKRSADALRDAKTEFQSLVNAVKEYAIFRLAPDGTIASWNEGAKAIKGYDDDVIGEHISMFYTQAEREMGIPQQNLDEAAAKGSIEDKGWRVRKDGSRFWASVTITALRDDDGATGGFLKITRDMTEQHEREKGLESELHHILDRVSDGFFGLDNEWRFTYINERAAELLNISPEDAKGEVLWDVFPEAANSQFHRNYMWAMSEQESVSFEEHFAPLESWFEVSAYPSVTGLSVYFRDVTERREREQAIRDRERDLRAQKEYINDVLNSIDDLFYVIDGRGHFQRWNRSVRTVTGYSESEMETMDPVDLIVEEDRDEVVRAIGKAFKTGHSRVEARIKTKDGEEIPMEFVASTINTPSDGLLIAGIGRDITERKKRQRQLEESNERLEQFAYAASHDLQEPLRMISSYLQLIEDRYEDALDDDGREFLNFAVDGADRMRDMINGLLAYSRIESEGDTFERVELDDVVADVLDTLQMMYDEQEADITVKPLPCVTGDRTQLRQLFQNLLENAIKNSGEDPLRIHISADRDGSQRVISVRDEGVGIDPADTERIFEMFQTLDAPDENGSGIGLALCKRIVERHGGDIWVDSSTDEGTTFSFTLPVGGDGGE
jgi:PAS domain S-box-containing protein